MDDLPIADDYPHSAWCDDDDCPADWAHRHRPDMGWTADTAEAYDYLKQKTDPTAWSEYLSLKRERRLAQAAGEDVPRRRPYWPTIAVPADKETTDE